MKRVVHTVRFVVLLAVAPSMVVGCSLESDPPVATPAPASASQTSELTTDGGGAGSGSGGGSARDSGHNPDPGAFGAACASGSDCESNVCFEGGKGGTCSLACTRDSDCPPGADGTIDCNPHGYCRY